MALGDGEGAVGLQRLEANSGQTNLELEAGGSSNGSVASTKKSIPTLSKRWGDSKNCCSTVNTGDRHVGDAQRGW
jgi:hypothetical protein